MLQVLIRCEYRSIFEDAVIYETCAIVHRFHILFISCYYKTLFGGSKCCWFSNQDEDIDRRHFYMHYFVA